jgi:hypothetical protein
MTWVFAASRPCGCRVSFLVRVSAQRVLSEEIAALKSAKR